MRFTVLKTARQLALFLALALLVTGCGGFFASSDPRPVEEIVAKAEELANFKAYEAAADLYGRALAKQPDNGRYYLRRSELLEALGLDKDSRANYHRALKKVVENAPERQELIQRLALLSAEDLQDIDTAEDQLEKLPAGSVPRLDLAGYLYYQAKQYELAIKLFNQALAATEDPNQKAMVLYHAALVYEALKDDKNSVTSLYHAINLATHLGQIRKISIVWTRINTNQPLPAQVAPKN